MKHRVNTHQNSSEPNFIKLLQNHEASRQILAFIFIALMSLAANANPQFINLALILIVFGAIFRLIASGVIVKNKELCTIGIYSLVRHPLYTGNLLILIGFSCLANMIAWYILLTAFIIFYYPPAIKYEDEKLKNKILENKDVLTLNYDLMQLSEPDMSSSITSNIRNIVGSPINGLNSFSFKKEFMIDKLYTAFKNVDTWLVNTWQDLDKYSKQTKK